MNARRFVDGNALSTASAINTTAPSLHRKDIDRAALRHLGILAGEQQIHARLHLGRVDAPTGLHRDVLLAVYWNDTGTAATPDMVGNSQRIFPVLASKARNMRSLVPPANSTSPPVANTGPQLNDGRLVVHTFLPVSTFQAWSSPM